MRPRRAAAVLAAAGAALALAAVLAAPAQAGSAGAEPGAATATRVPGRPDLRRPASLDRPPPGRRLTARRVLALADREAEVRRERARHPGSTREAFLKGARRWQVSYYGRGRKEIAQVLVEDSSGRVTETWTGDQVAWTMARGYPGAFGRKANAVYIWLPLCVLFLLPFLRPPLRLLHLDLLVLLSFSVSLAFFNDGRIDVSVPLAYPPLAYLLVRMLLLARRPRRPRPPPALLVSARWLGIGALFLIGFRVGLNVTDSNVIDVGYASVVGADRLAGGESLYGDFPSDVSHGDTYGPVTYAAYVPFELLLPWSGGWGDLPAAHLAAVAWDLLTLAGLALLGWRLGGGGLAALLPYAWLTFPFTLMGLETNANDGLVAALLVGILLASSGPARRGALAALAGLAKIAPLALAPALAAHRASSATVARFAAGFTMVAALALVLVAGAGDLGDVYDRTVGFQAGRDSPFSVWGQYDGLDAVQTAVKAAAVALALAAALPARRTDVPGLAALAAAVLVGLQLAVDHWFYLYLVWLAPLVLVALLAPRAPERRLEAPA